MVRLSRWFLGVFAIVLLAGLATPAPALAGEVQGKIKKVAADDFQFVLEDNQGKTRTFMMDEDAQVLINGKQAKLVDLRAGDLVTIDSRQEGERWMAIQVRCKRP